MSSVRLDSRHPRKVGFLYPGHRDPEFESWRLEFLRCLEDLSWVEGVNLHVEWRFAQSDSARYTALAADPAWAGVDVLVTGSTPLTHALKQARPSTPIVTGVGDPVGSGFATSLESPGYNITGLSWALREKARSQVGLLVEMVPTVQNLLVLRSRRHGEIPELNACLEEVAREHALIAEIHTAETFAEIEHALGRVAVPMTSVAIAYRGAFHFNFERLAEVAIHHGIAAIGDDRSASEAGCLMSYGTHHANLARSFASLVDRILRGDNPAQMAFELPDRSEFVVNQATAALLGLALSPDLLRRADAVIG
jgi:putative tryptophan/tyrosine transport system substrate-binding protein